jgi:DNA-binding response OmpR family regulator
LGAGTQEFLKQFGLPYVAKPFRMEEFTEKIALVLREAASSEGASRDASFGRKNLAGHG